MPPKILLVDENRDGRLVRSAVLEEAGYVVQSAASGEDGLKLYRSSEYDVIVTGHRMPRMDGVELITRIRKLNPNARVVLLSGFVEALGLNEENTGADAVIAKSSGEPAQLKRIVKRLISRGDARKPPASFRGAAVRARANGR